MKKAQESALVLVEATQMGYYDHKRQRQGQQFMMQKHQAEKCKWVEIVEVTPKAAPVTRGLGGIKAPLPNPVKPIPAEESQDSVI